MISQGVVGLGSAFALFLGFGILLITLDSASRTTDQELEKVRSGFVTYFIEQAEQNPKGQELALRALGDSPAWRPMLALRAVTEAELQQFFASGSGAKTLLSKVEAFGQKQRHALSLMLFLLLLTLMVILLTALAFYALSEQRRQWGDRLRQLHQQSLVAIEAERKAISRDLHDTVAQDLVAVKMLLSQGSLRPEQDQLMRNSLDSALNQVRQVAHGLRPASLDRVGLAASLKELCERVMKTSGLVIHADLPHQDPRPLGDTIAVNVFRIAQEALNNTVVHSQSRSASLQLSISEESLRFLFRDDGIGLGSAPEEHRTGERSLGLVGMQERARLMGGTLKIESTRGAGIRLSLEVPL